jgi:hypothetical protein
MHAGVATEVSGKTVGVPELEDVEVVGEDCMGLGGKGACGLVEELRTDSVAERGCVEVTGWIVVAEVHDERSAHGGKRFRRVGEDDAQYGGDEFRRWVLDLGSVLGLTEHRMCGLNGVCW